MKLHHTYGNLSKFHWMHDMMIQIIDAQACIPFEDDPEKALKHEVDKN
jgi:hypothetical protein